MSKMAHFLGQLGKCSKVDKFHSYDGIIRIKWLYNHPRVNLCEKGERKCLS